MAIMETVVGLLGGATIAVVGWAFHQGSRTSTLEAKVQGDKESIEKLLDTKFEAITAIIQSSKENLNETMDGVDKRLERIERKLWNGGYHAQS